MESGEYPDANNQEDDLSIIKATWDIALMMPGDTASTASVLATSTTLAAAGLIGSSSDVDVYRFAAGPGAAAIDVKSASVGPDLDILAELRDSAGNLIASSNPADSLSPISARRLRRGPTT